jgi:uncharacterized spore protein YtfJ
MTGTRGRSSDSEIDIIERGVNKIVGGLAADTVFGKPEHVGDRVVITAASVQRAGGFGFGSGSGTEPGEEGGGSGAGGGGGGATEGRPVAVIEVGPDGVRVRPVLDFTRIGITAITALLTVAKVGRGRHRHRRRGA